MYLKILLKLFSLFFIIKSRSLVDDDVIDTGSLYDPRKDMVIVLNARNYMEILNRTKGLVVVEYYAAWCGHCINFRKTYRRLCAQASFWGVYFAAMNCAHPGNAHACEVNNIHLYPTIKIYACALNKRTNPIDLRNLTKSSSLHSIRNAVAQYLINENDCGVSVHASTELSESFFADFKRSSTAYDLIVLILGHDDDRGILDSISLDMRICPRIFVSFLPLSSPFVSNFGSYHQHTLLVVNKDVEITRVTEDFDDYEELRKALHKATKEQCPESVVFSTQAVEETKVEVLKDQNVQKSSEINMKDIISGIGMALREEIPRKPLEQKDYSFIKDFVDAFEECIPWPKPQKDFMKTLKSWVALQGGMIQNKDWSSLLNSTAAVEAFPYEKTWITCRGMTPNFRQYPCSLWLSFHIGTITCEKSNGESGATVTSLDVILAARGFIINFFSCFVCREHFKELTKYAKDRIKSSEDAMIFLWDGHNNVNARLRHDDSADPTAPKVQFPPVEMCAPCWNVNGLIEEEMYTSNPGYGISPIKWNKRSVLEFLRSYYGPDNIRVVDANVSERSDLYDSSSEFAKTAEIQRKRR